MWSRIVRVVVRPYPTYLCHREQMKISSMVERRFFESLVGAVVILEECGGGVKSIAKFGDLGASGVGWVGGYRAGVDGNYKRGDG